MGRYRSREREALKKSRAGRWFFEHDRVDAFEFVGEVGTSDLVPEVKDGQLFRAGQLVSQQRLRRVVEDAVRAQSRFAKRDRE